MMLLQVLLPLDIVLATGALAWAYASGHQWSGALILIGLGLLWLLGYFFLRWYWAGTLAVLCFFSLVVAGSLAGLSMGWLLAGVLAALAAWDLDHFAQRVREAIEESDEVRDTGREAVVIRHHLLRLGVVIAVGGLLAILALQVRVRFGFAVAVFLTFASVLGLSQAVRMLRREGR